jgi:hypothetical protein
MTDLQWALEALILEDVEAAEKRRRDDHRAWFKALLVRVTGTGLLPRKPEVRDAQGNITAHEEDGIVGLGYLTGHREIMAKIMAEADELLADERAATDEDFDTFSANLERAARGEAVAPEVQPIARLLTEDHTARERDAGRTMWNLEVARAGIKQRDPEAGLADVDRPTARDDDGPPGLEFDDDVAAAYSEAGTGAQPLTFPPRAPTDTSDAYRRLAHARATGGASLMSPEEAKEKGAIQTPKPEQRPLEEQAYAANLDPATAPLHLLARTLRVPQAPAVPQPPTLRPFRLRDEERPKGLELDGDDDGTTPPRGAGR